MLWGYKIEVTRGIQIGHEQAHDARLPYSFLLISFVRLDDVHTELEKYEEKAIENQMSCSTYGVTLFASKQRMLLCPTRSMQP